MNTIDIENKIEQFRQFLAKIVMIREDLMVNAPDEEACEIYGDLHELARKIDQEFAKTFPTKLTVGTNEQT
jgi:hypothetical protein